MVEKDRCSECGRPARLSATADGQTRRLCDRCLDSFLEQAGMARFLTSFVKPRAVADHCPHCQTTAKSVAETGMAGCPLCFEAFPHAWKAIA
jgi:protein-arginine kinase activator protein McsA